MPMLNDFVTSSSIHVRCLCMCITTHKFSIIKINQDHVLVGIFKTSFTSTTNLLLQIIEYSTVRKLVNFQKTHYQSNVRNQCFMKNTELYKHKIKQTSTFFKHYQHTYYLYQACYINVISNLCIGLTT